VLFFCGALQMLTAGMKMIRKNRVRNSCILLCVFGLVMSGCNRGALRLYGTGSSFPWASTNFSSPKQYPYTVFVSLPEDKTSEYYGHSIAGTSWQGTRTDTFEENTMRDLIRQELRRELQSAKIFTGVSSAETADGLILETEIRAFGAQVRGFIWNRVGGVSSFEFTLKKNGKILFKKAYEKVVTDADPEYTGSGIGFIEDAMRATMSDSFREVLKELFSDLELINI
jgi:hypothetical protein